MTPSKRHTAILPLLLVLLSSLAWPSEARAKTKGTLDEGAWLGVFIRNGAPGVLVTEVILDSPAELAGLAPGDEIRRIDDTAIFSPDQLTQTVKSYAVGSEVRVAVVRGGRPLTLPVELGNQMSEREILARTWLGNSVPNFRLPRVVGDGAGELRQHEGRVVAIVFWSGPCLSCFELLNELVAFSAQQRGRASVVVISAESPDLLRKRFSSSADSLTVLSDAKGVYRARMRIPEPGPAVLLLGRDHRVEYVDSGRELDVEALSRASGRLLGRSAHP